MLIRGTRIRSVDRYLGRIKKGTSVIFGVPLAGQDSKLLERIGFNKAPGLGDAVLPAPVFGTVSRFNAEGKDKVHKDQPKETAYRQAEWTWEEWHGRYDRLERSKIVDVPYKRYPRTFIPPPSVELAVQEGKDGELIIATPSTAYEMANESRIVHLANLMLEIFGYCQILTGDLEEIPLSKLRRVNWEVLPRGRRPWKKLEHELKQVIDGASEGNQPVIRHRLEVVNRYEPDFVAVGRAGFRGYLIFGFPEKELYVLESAYTGNATYVFGEDWDSLSKLTKAEILSDDLQEARLIHREGWEQSVKRLLG